MTKGEGRQESSVWVELLVAASEAEAAPGSFDTRLTPCSRCARLRMTKGGGMKAEKLAATSYQTQRNKNKISLAMGW